MGNCLATYWQQCQNSNSRIFTVRVNGKLKAAVQIINQGTRWTRDQAQAPHNLDFDRHILQATDKLARAYQEAETHSPNPSIQAQQ